MRKNHLKYALYELKTLGIREVFWHIILYLTKSDYAKTMVGALSEPYLSSMTTQEWETRIKHTFRSRTGECLNLKTPKTFNEKIQWLKLYDNKPIKVRLADKYLVREWIQEKLGSEYLIPLLGVWDSPDEVDFSTLPDRFVLKANHGSGMILIVKDKSSLNVKKARKSMTEWLKNPYGLLSGEQHYHLIPRKIIAEEYIEQNNGNLYDYKIHCFNGNPELIQVIGDRDFHTHFLRNLYYDTNWKALPITYNYPLYEEEMPRPAQLEQMLSIAQKLCRDFIYVRVDFYLLDNGEIKFGEMTFHPYSGFCSWEPPEANLLMGEKIRLPEVDS